MIRQVRDRQINQRYLNTQIFKQIRINANKVKYEKQVKHDIIKYETKYLTNTNTTLNEITK